MSYDAGPPAPTSGGAGPFGGADPRALVAAGLAVAMLIHTFSRLMRVSLLRSDFGDGALSQAANHFTVSAGSVVALAVALLLVAAVRREGRPLGPGRHTELLVLISAGTLTLFGFLGVIAVLVQDDAFYGGAGRFTGVLDGLAGLVAVAAITWWALAVKPRSAPQGPATGWSAPGTDQGAAGWGQPHQQPPPHPQQQPPPQPHHQQQAPPPQPHQQQAPPTPQPHQQQPPPHQGPPAQPQASPPPSDQPGGWPPPPGSGGA